MGDGRKEVIIRNILLSNLCHEVGHLYAYIFKQVEIEELVLFFIYLVMVSFLTDLPVNKAAFPFR